MTAEDFWEWRAYADLEPFDEERADLRMAQVCRILSEINRDEKKRKEPYTIAEFMFRFGAATAGTSSTPQTWQEQKALMRSFRKSAQPKPRPLSRKQRERKAKEGAKD